MKNKLSSIFYISILTFLILVCIANPAFSFPLGGSKPKRGGSLYGFVITSSGINEPGARYTHVQGAKIEVKGAGGVFKAVTDNMGAFQFDSIPPGNYTVTISKRGYGTVIKQLEILDVRVKKLENIALVPGDQATATQELIVPDTIFAALIFDEEAYTANKTELGELRKLLFKNPDEPIFMPGPYEKQAPISVYENSIMVIPPGDVRKIRYLKLDHQPCWLCFNISGNILYVADADSRIHIYDVLRNNLKIGYIPLSSAVYFMKLSPDGKWLFAANTDGINVIDTKTQTLANTMEMPKMSNGQKGEPWAMTFGPGGKILYVVLGEAGSGEVIAIDASTKQPVSRVMTGAQPTGIAITPDGSRIFTANNNSASVSVLSTNPLKLIKNVPVGVSPSRVAVTPGGEKVLVTNKGSGSVSILSARTGENLAAITVGKFPTDITITSDGQKAFVTNSGDRTISIIDIKNMRELRKTTPQPLSKPMGITVKP